MLLFFQATSAGESPKMGNTSVNMSQSLTETNISSAGKSEEDSFLGFLWSKVVLQGLFLFLYKAVSECLFFPNIACACIGASFWFKRTY